MLTTRKLQPLARAQSYTKTIDMPSWVPDWTIPTKDLSLAELTKIASHLTLDTAIGVDGPSTTDAVPGFVDDMLDNLVHLFCIFVL